jgi:hypothetical protein
MVIGNVREVHHIIPTEHRYISLHACKVKENKNNLHAGQACTHCFPSLVMAGLILSLIVCARYWRFAVQVQVAEDVAPESQEEK